MDSVDTETLDLLASTSKFCEKRSTNFTTFSRAFAAAEGSAFYLTFLP